MTETLQVLLGSGLTLLGVGAAGGFALRQQRLRAELEREEERRTDLREAVDIGLVTLAEAEFEIFIADIRAQALVEGHTAEPYIETDVAVNDALRALIIAGGRLKIRAPLEGALLAAFDATHDALVEHRALIKSVAERRTLDDRLSASRDRVTSLRRRYEKEGAGVVTPRRTETGQRAGRP